MTYIATTGIYTGAPLTASFQGGLADLLVKQAVERPEHAALVFNGQSLSYRDLAGKSLAISRQLQELGVEAGDRVALAFPNHPDYVASFFAAQSLGATVVPINPLLRSEEVAHILADSSAKVIIAHQAIMPQINSAVAGLESLQAVVVAGAMPESFRAPAKLVGLAEEKSDLSGAVSWPRAIEPDRVLALLVYTSGTTGKPKGAMLTHSNLLFAVSSALNVCDLRNKDRMLAVLPLCHIYGLTVVMCGMIAVGGTIVVQPKFDATETMQTISEQKVTVLPLVPAMYQFLLMEAEKNGSPDLSAVRLCLSGASAMPPDLIPPIEALFDSTLVEGYGLTEVTCLGTLNPLHGLRKPGSVGIPFPGVSIAIWADNGPVTGRGADNVGEVAISGRNVMQGYYGLPASTAETFEGGWFLSGDLGYVDEDGYLFIVGRKKELIIRGGQNIYPREIEDVIVRMPQVAETAVVGVPDRFMGERVKAFVVVKNGFSLSEDEVKQFCARSLAPYKVPRLIEFTPDLPRNSTGKVLKRLLT